MLQESAVGSPGSEGRLFWISAAADGRRRRWCCTCITQNLISTFAGLPSYQNKVFNRYFEI